MSPNSLVYIAIVVFLLMLIGLVLTIIEFKSGAPKEQMEDKEKMQDSPHGHVD